ncbi:hypothetical protein QEH52_17150 [Coraliomargarita sp. SDUM461003]|uniref:1,4-beta-xylanase n=1 Tax=Thalassobacterium maritimum TaxID=3041265 RepID=A0ABU1B1C6_9BACT|nr:hypothetical protein [Coraliomargarita sp. SDUM461003]MDQ8209257.1 hypothetical protein [Coraliomargarita sp. SDUM461003]
MSDSIKNMLPVQRGVTFGFYARNGVLGSEWARREVDHMLELNVGHVVLTPIVMQESSHSTRQYRDFEVTPNDHELYQIIEYMKLKGIEVTMRPMLETQDGSGRLQVWFQPDRERIPGRVSDHWKRWFDSMILRSRHYAKIAAETGCARYGLDSELDRTIHQGDGWQACIAAVREVFSGAVTSCHTTHCGLIDWEKELSKPQHWWLDLDELQMSCYESGADAPGSTVEQMIERLKPVRERFRKLAKAYGKPISFGECGCTSSYGGAMNPSGWKGQGGYAPMEQANYLEAVLSVFWDEPWWAGIYWWKWDEQNMRAAFNSDPAGDKGFTVYDKPAGNVMKKWFAREDRR